MAGLICGIGTNDAGYRVAINTMVNGKRKEIWRCPFYRVWMNMLCRCYSESFQARSPTYKGCSVSSEWLKFSRFKAWMISQNWKDMDLDKDLLIFGNKIYGEEYCLFVSRKVNGFLLDCAAARGRWPQGVYWNAGAKKFQAYCHNQELKKPDYLGLFLCPDAAHEAWRRRKHEYALRLADEQEDPRVAAALRTRYSSPKGN